MNITARITLIVFLVTGIGLYYFVDREIEVTVRRYREATEEPLVDFATVLAALVAENSKDGSIDPSFLRNSLAHAKQEIFKAKIYDFEKTSVDLRIYVTDDKGIVLFDSDEGRDEGQNYLGWKDVRLTLTGEYGARTSRIKPEAKTSVLYVAAPIKINGAIKGVLTVGKPTENANLFIYAAQQSTYALGLVTFIGIALLATLLALVVTRPIHKLTQYVRATSEGNRPPLPALPSGELSTLAQAFEDMREALEGKKYIEKYVQTLTHELKSPLSAIKGAAELLTENPPPESRQKFLSNIERESTRIQQLIDRLLGLSNLQAKRTLEDATEIDLAAIVQDATDSLTPAALTKEVTLHKADSAPIKMKGSAFWIREAVSNLLQNAIEFSPRGGLVTIKLQLESSAAIIQIEDAGVGIPEWALPRIFEQFYSLARPDSERKSSGLGLPIVKEVAELHQGSITISNNAPTGVIARLSFPLSA